MPSVGTQNSDASTLCIEFPGSCAGRTRTGGVAKPNFVRSAARSNLLIHGPDPRARAGGRAFGYNPNVDTRSRVLGNKFGNFSNSTTSSQSG